MSDEQVIKQEYGPEPVDDAGTFLPMGDYKTPYGVFPSEWNSVEEQMHEISSTSDGEEYQNVSTVKTILKKQYGKFIEELKQLAQRTDKLNAKELERVRWLRATLQTTRAQLEILSEQSRAIGESFLEKENQKKKYIQDLQSLSERAESERMKFREQAAAAIVEAVKKAPSLNKTGKKEKIEDIVEAVKVEIPAEPVVAELVDEPDPKVEAVKVVLQAEPTEKIPSFEHLNLAEVEAALVESSDWAKSGRERLDRLKLAEQTYEEQKKDLKMRFRLKGDTFETGNQEQIARKKEIEETERYLDKLRVTIHGLVKRKKELTENATAKPVEPTPEPVLQTKPAETIIQAAPVEPISKPTPKPTPQNEPLKTSTTPDPVVQPEPVKQSVEPTPVKKSEPIESSKPTETETKESNFSETMQKEFGLTREDLRSLGFEGLEPSQQALALENLRQLTLGRIHEEASDKLDAEMGKQTEGNLLKRSGQVLGKIWKGFTHTYQIAKQEKTTAQQLQAGGLAMHGETLQKLIESAKAGPNASFDKDGKVQVDFLDISDPKFKFLLESESGESVKNFQSAARALSGIPREYAYPEATKEQKKQYGEAKDALNGAKAALLGQFLQRDVRGVLMKAGKAEDFLEAVNQAEYHIEMQRFFNQYPDAENAIIELADQGVINRVYKSLWREVQAGTQKENIIYFVLGAARSTVVAGIGLAAAPLAGAGFGAWRGWRQAKENLVKQDKKSRLKGEVGEKKTAKNILKSYRAEERLAELVNAYDSLKNDQEKSEMRAKIKTRLEYTKRKLEEGLISFDGKTTNDEKNQETIDTQSIRVGQQMQLLSVLARAEIYASDSIGEESTLTRLERFLDHREVSINDARTKYKIGMLAKGAAIGLGAATASVALRAAWDHGFFDWAHHLDGKADSVAVLGVAQKEQLAKVLNENNLKSVVSPVQGVVTPEATQQFAPAAIPQSSEMIPAHIDIKIPLDVQHISGKSIEGEMIKQLMHDQGVSHAEAGKLAHRAVLAFAKEHHLGASQLHQLDHIRSADLDMRIVNGRPEILELNTIPTRGHEAIHIARTVLPHTATPPASLAEQAATAVPTSASVPQSAVPILHPVETRMSVPDIIQPDVSDLQDKVLPSVTENLLPQEVVTPSAIFEQPFTTDNKALDAIAAQSAIEQGVHQTYAQTFKEMLDSALAGSTLQKPELLKSLAETSSVDSEAIEKTFGKSFNTALLVLEATLIGALGYSLLRFRRKKSLAQVIHEVSDAAAHEVDPKKKEEIIKAVNVFEKQIKNPKKQVPPKQKASEMLRKESEQKAKKQKEREQKQQEKVLKSAARAEAEATAKSAKVKRDAEARVKRDAAKKLQVEKNKKNKKN
ncbi:MAG: hypothetical protein WCG84_01705 [Candidatus Moraniibacteriota bacterium]